MARMFQTLGNTMRAPTDTLKITCGACKHEATWSRTRAIKTFGESARPYDLGRKLKCSRCRENSHIRVWI
jgi:hypothetical protein